jgi:histidinol-phosphatase
MPALDVIVREAGGRFTSLDGQDGPTGGNALATNGILHETVLGFLGSVNAEDGVYDLSSRRRPASPPQEPSSPGFPPLGP